MALLNTSKAQLWDYFILAARVLLAYTFIQYGYAKLTGGLEQADLVGFDVETEGRVPVSVVSWRCRCLCWVESPLTRSVWHRCERPCKPS